MRSVVVNSPASAISGLVEVIAAEQPTHFVDYGCGTGAVLLRVAKQFPELSCVGVDCDSAALDLARKGLDGAGLERVTLVEGDALKHIALASDTAYCYLGGALNQRLGHALLDHGACRMIVAARYPIISAVPASQLLCGDVVLYLYRPAACSGLIEWDALATQVQIPLGTLYLLGRAIRVTRQVTLTLTQRILRPGPAYIRDAEFGFDPARPGVPIICDMLLGCRADADCDALTVVEVTVHADGNPLTPSHLLLLRVAQTGCPSETTVEDCDGLRKLMGDLPPVGA
jgi:hypothetical protein